MCNCKLCRICDKPIILSPNCTEHNIKDLVTSPRLGKGILCFACEKQVVIEWFERHGITWE